MPSTPFSMFFIPLSAALGLAVVVERILEFIQNIFETIPLRSNTIRIPSTKSEQEVTKTLEEVRQIESKVGELDDCMHDSGTVILVEDATDPDDGKVFKKCVLMLLGFAMGIVLAKFSDLGLFGALFPGLKELRWFDNILTGLLIGGGSAPVHSLINFIVERKSVLDTAAATTDIRATTATVESAVPVSTIDMQPAIPLAKAIDPYGWINIRYDGGVDKEALENTHFRKNAPTHIIYHHTAMHSSSTFEDVVRVIKDREYDVVRVRDGKRVTEKAHWLTGYHCVILADGSIHPFCRWDRTGIHAGDTNTVSLGIAFNGNFETESMTSGTNRRNKYGIDRPTAEQLSNGARVMTLWALLYGIAIDFTRFIIPHKKAEDAHTLCPGSNFPRAELETLIQRYHDSWSGDARTMKFIDDFKMKPYVSIRKMEVTHE